MPVGFSNVDACWAFVMCGAADSMHVSASREVAVCKFHDEDLGAVLHSAHHQCLSRDIPVDGSKGVTSPTVPGH
jgi:hypothetical protein